MSTGHSRSHRSTGSEGPSRDWRAWITETAEAELLEAAEKAQPRETGGVLVGVLAERLDGFAIRRLKASRP